MKNLVLACLLGSVGTAWVGHLQDPPPAPVPAPATTPPPPAAATKEPAARPTLEGVYELRARVVDGVADQLRSRGYVAITKRHMLVCLVGPGSDPDLPLLRAGVRTWRAEREDQVRTEFRLGFFTDEEGGVHLESPGTAEIKRIEQVRGFVRIWQDARSYLEFDRIE